MAPTRQGAIAIVRTAGVLLGGSYGALCTLAYVEGRGLNGGVL